MHLTRVLAGCVVVTSTFAVHGQLVLEKKIPIAGMTGGFDHLAYDQGTERIFATAEDQGKVYVVSLESGKGLTSIGGFGKPHSILVRPGSPSVLVVDSEPNKSALLDSHSLTKIKSLQLPPGANAMIYDPKHDRAIITAGGDRVNMNTSQVAGVDPSTGHTIKSTNIEALHLQPMAIDLAGGRVFVSIADHKSIAVLDLRTLRQTGEWKFGLEKHHHQPVAFDGESHRIFIAIDHPGQLLVVNSDTGKQTSSIDIPGDADDLTFDSRMHRLLIPCGDGFLTVVDASDPDHSRVTQKIQTGSDAGTGIWLAGQRKYVLGVPRSGSMDTPEVWVFGEHK